MTQETIHVIIRFRPTNKREKKEAKKLKIQDKPIIFQNNDDKKIGAIEICAIKASEPLRFTFDRILDDNLSQSSTFNHVAEHVCNDVLAGYNGCIFAYGQTGSGKTYTMFGPEDSVGDPRLMGIIPRSVSYIFSEIEDAPDIIEARVNVSFIEIYKEKLRDLLNPSSKKQLKIRLNKNHETQITNVTETHVMTLIDVLKLIGCANKYRTKAETSMNRSSSRSHMLMVLTVAIKIHDGSIRVGKLNMVDLAGSEKVRKTNATGNRLKEAQKINLSLTVLGQVISSLAENRKHVPFRDSKLTHVLRDSLGGNCKTTLVVNASKHMFNRDETIISLRFGSRCKLITNNVKVNKILNNNELKVLIGKLRKENTKLQLELKSERTASVDMRSSSYSMSESVSIFDPTANKLFDKRNQEKNKLLEQIEQYKHKINQLDEQNNELKAGNVKCEQNRQQMVGKLEEYETQRNKMETQIVEYQMQQNEFNRNINDMEDDNEALKSEVRSLKHRNKDFKMRLEDITKNQHFEATTLNAELSKFKELHNDVTEETAALIQEINKLKQSSQNSQLIINAQHKQLNVNQQEMTQLDKTLADKDKKIVQLQTELKELKSKLNQYEMDINELKSDHDQIIAAQNDEICAKDDEIERLKIELEDRTQKLTEENHKLAQQIDIININNQQNVAIDEENEQILHEDDESDDGDEDEDDIYSFEFTSKPFGLTFEHTPDKKNIHITDVTKHSVADSNVLRGSSVVKFEQEMVENLGSRQVYNIFKSKYATVLPLKITFRKCKQEPVAVENVNSKMNNHKSEVSVDQILRTATLVNGDEEEKETVINTDQSIMDNVEYLKKLETERLIKRHTIIESGKGKNKSNNPFGLDLEALDNKKRDRFTFKRHAAANNLLTERKSMEHDIKKKEKELDSVRKMSLPNNPGKRMNILINMAVLEDDIVCLNRKLGAINKKILKKSKKKKRKKTFDEMDEDVAVYQEAIYGNKQPRMQLNNDKSVDINDDNDVILSKVTTVNVLDENIAVAALQFSDTIYPDFEAEEKDETDQELLEELAVKLKKGLEIKDRRFMFNTYHKCFVGKEAVTFMLKVNICKSRQEGVSLGKMLLSANVIKNVTTDREFKDEKVLYRFLSDEPGAEHIEI